MRPSNQSDSAYLRLAELHGPRDEMEDAIVVQEDIRDGISLFTVFDGHARICTATTAAFLVAKDVQSAVSSRQPSSSVHSEG